MKVHFNERKMIPFSEVEEKQIFSFWNESGNPEIAVKLSEITYRKDKSLSDEEYQYHKVNAMNLVTLDLFYVDSDKLVISRDDVDLYIGNDY